MIKTILLFILLGLTLILLSPFGFICLIMRFLGLHSTAEFFVCKIAQAWSLLLMKSTGCPITVKGREHIPKKGGVCFVGNHASIFDILLVLGYAGRVVGFIAKKELSYIPFLNLWILLIGGLFIDRQSIRKAVKTIDKGAEKIKAGSSMLIFPEGHRSRGEGLLPFHAGSFKLASQSGAPIIPFAITGSYDVFERTYRVQTVPVSITFCAPINTAEMPAEVKRQQLSDMVYQVIKTELEQQAAGDEA